MSEQLKSLLETVTVEVPEDAHEWASMFAKKQRNAELAKKVYMNTLAVFAVHLYLLEHGIETDLDRSNSWYPGVLTPYDSADLYLPELEGKIECRPILLPDETELFIPECACYDRAAYVAVGFGEYLDRAEMLCYFPPFATNDFIPDSISLDSPDRKPVNELLPYLRGFIAEDIDNETSVEYFQEPFTISDVPVKELTEEIDLVKDTKKNIIDLKRWLDNVFTQGWRAVEELLTTQQLSPAVWSESALVKRAKQYQLGENLVNLVVELKKESEESVSISLKVYPSEDKGFLPEKLQLIISADGEELPAISLQEKTSGIEVPLKAKYGEEFSLTLKIDEYSITEEFKV